MTDLPEELEGVQHRAAVIESVADDERREILMRAVPYDHEIELYPDFFEQFERGAFKAAAKDPARIKFFNGHGGPIVGQGFEVRDESDGVWVRVKVSRTAAGDELMTLARDKVLDEASIEFRAIPSDMEVTQDGEGRLHVLHKRAHLMGVALVPHGAYSRGATVASVRKAEQEHELERQRSAAIQSLRSLNG